jgi:hypothetical protein
MNKQFDSFQDSPGKEVRIRSRATSLPQGIQKPFQEQSNLTALDAEQNEIALAKVAPADEMADSA